MPHPVSAFMRRAALVAACLVITGGALAAQVAHRPGDIHGTVVDTAGVPIGGARVTIAALGLAETTHADGSFHLGAVPAGRHTLAVAAIGHAAARQEITVAGDAPLELRVVLRRTVVRLEDIVVTGGVHGRARDAVLSPTSSVSGRALDRELAPTVAATLENQPGVAVTSVGPATARPVIRGLSGDRIVMLEDGQRPGDLSSTSGDHAVAMDPLTAERIEVVRGPMSLIYGSSALGGVVNVIREEVPRELPEHAHGVVSLLGSTGNRGGTVGGTVSSRAGPLALRAEASGQLTGNQRTPEGALDNTEVRSLNAGGGASLVRDWGHAGLAYRFFGTDYGIPGGFVGSHPEGVDIQMRRHMLRGEWEAATTTGPFVGWHADASYVDYYHAELEHEGEIGTEFDQQVLVGDLVARFDTVGPLTDGAVGLRAQVRDIETGGSLRTPSTGDYALAGFLVQELPLGPVRLQGGIRYDHAHYTPRDTTAYIDVGGERVPVRPRTFGSFSASVGVLVEPLAGLRVGASLARAYRTPDFNELYSNGPHLAAYSYDVGDPSLDQETGLGADLFVRLAREGTRAEVAVFRNALHGYISPSSRGRAELGTQGARPRFQYTNEDVRFSGAEGMLEQVLAPGLVLEGTVSYVAARFTSERDSIPVFEFETGDTTFVAASPYPSLIPPLNGNAGLRYERGPWSVGAGARWAAAQERAGDFETRTPGYLVGEASAAVRFAFGGRVHDVTLRLDNVTNRLYRNHLSRTKDVIAEPGRALSLLYRVSL